MVNPTKVSLIPIAIAMDDAPSTTHSPPIITPIKPATMYSMLLPFPIVGFSIYFASLDFLAVYTRYETYKIINISKINPSNLFK